ncbi:hypothetical protein RZP13_24120, partial [Klebsiella quasipneumoniae subsp. similipneumoniae]|nr:hypothetical protein [Klebsiella quasipneumoniae subsp. similipneumoniae]
TVCVVGKMRDLILQLSKSSIYSTKPSGSRKILSRIHFVNNGFKSQGHAFAWLFYYQVPQESSSTRFVVKSSLTGLTLFKHTASRSSIGGGNYG